MSTFQIDSMAFGGEGVARSDGMVVFIPFTLETEEVEATITEKKKHFARAINSLLKYVYMW